MRTLGRGCGEHVVPLLCVLGLGTIVATTLTGGLRQKKARDCLVRLAAGPARCPDPAEHLPSDPRFENGRFRQTLPATESAADFPVARGTCTGGWRRPGPARS